MHQYLLKKDLKCYGPDHELAYAKFTPAASPATQVLTEGQGIVSIVRTAAGTWTVTFARKPYAITPVHAQVMSATAAQVRCESESATAGTAVVTHRLTGVMTTHAVIPDISTASSTGYAIAPCAGKVTAVRGVLHGAISAGDAVVTTGIRSGGGAFAAITNGGFTVAQSGSAAGDQDSGTPTAANTVAKGDALRAVSDGGSTDAAIETVQFEITPDPTDPSEPVCLAFLLRVAA